MNAVTQEIRLSSIATLPMDGEPAGVRELREHAAARFNALGLPTTRLEGWKYTNLAPLSRVDFRLAAATPDGERPDDRGFRFEQHAASEVILVNGRITGSSATELPAGLQVRPLRVAIQDPAVAKVLGSVADFEDQAMTALNLALTQDGVVVEVAPGTVIEGFIHILHVGRPEDVPVMSHPRNLVIAGANSQLSVVETYVGNGRYFTNAVTEIVAADGAVVEHTKIEYESMEAFHVGTVQIRQERSSSVTSRSFALGGALVRNEIHGALAGEGAALSLEGLFALTGTQHVDNHTVIDHRAPHCESLELFKGILDQSSRGIFDGLIVVRPGAMKTNSRQTNKNLLLSETAIVDSKPMLEIYNDDVKCTHGSTIGQLDEEAMFYLRSRGIGADEAKNLLVHAFASEIVERIRFDAVREQVRRVLFQSITEVSSERRGDHR